MFAEDIEMLLVTIVNNIMNRYYLPGDVIVSVEGLRFEIVSASTFIVNAVGRPSRYLCDISQVSQLSLQSLLPMLGIGQSAHPASLAG